MLINRSVRVLTGPERKTSSSLSETETRREVKNMIDAEKRKKPSKSGLVLQH